MPKFTYTALYRHIGATKRAPWKTVVTHINPTGVWASKLAALQALHTAMGHDPTIRGHVHRKLVVKKTYLRLRALEEMGKLVGVMEVGGNNRGPVVSKIIEENGGTGPEPWCGDTVAYAYRKAGSKVVQRAWAAVVNLGFLSGMRILKTKLSALAGDILVFEFNGDGVPDHTGLLRYWLRYVNGIPVKCPAREATHAATREGNTGARGAVSDSTTGGDGVYDKIRELAQIQRAVRVYR